MTESELFRILLGVLLSVVGFPIGGLFLRKMWAKNAEVGSEIRINNSRNEHIDRLEQSIKKMSEEIEELREESRVTFVKLSILEGLAARQGIDYKAEYERNGLAV